VALRSVAALEDQAGHIKRLRAHRAVTHRFGDAGVPEEVLEPPRIHSASAVNSWSAQKVMALPLGMSFKSFVKLSVSRSAETATKAEQQLATSKSDVWRLPGVSGFNSLFQQRKQ
jgi:hypothetical protein